MSQRRLAVIHVGGASVSGSVQSTLHLLWQKLEPEIRIITQIQLYSALLLAFLALMSIKNFMVGALFFFFLGGGGGIPPPYIFVGGVVAPLPPLVSLPRVPNNL